MRAAAAVGLAITTLTSAGFAAEPKWASIPDGQLAYTDTGSGSTAILIHGGLQDYRFWNEIVHLLPNRRVISYSRRSHYPNDISANVVPDNAADLHADDLALFMNSIGVAKAQLIAHSSGAHVALFFAAKYPGMVQSLAVHEPPAVGLLAGDAENEIILKEIGARLAPSRTAFVNNDLETGARLFTDAINGPGTYERRSDADRRMIGDNAASHAADATSRRPRVPFTCQSAGSISAPVLVTTSENSLNFFHRIASVLERCLARKEKHQFAGASHTVQSEQPAKYAETIASFLARN
jgi:pimeloyl-ACP methyl ester carboxylesterase